MAKINKVINVKVEGVGKIKQLEDSLKKLRKQQRDIKKDMKDGANAGKHAEQQYKKNENAIKGQSRALRETKKAMLDANNTTRKSTSLQKSMTMGVIQGAAAFSILVTAFRRVSQALVTMIGTFTEFEFTMAKVKAVSGANAEEFKKLSDSAQELGRSTFFTASEVANLQLNLSKLGFTTEEILEATQATINLSIATGSDLARSATVAGNAIRGFQLDASEAGRVVDVMAVAFTSSALDIEKWQTSMTKVAPIATMAGFSIEETTAIMAKLSDTGIEASIAGTSLRNIFLKMQDPTSDLTRRVGHTISSLDRMLEVFKEMQDEGTDLGEVLTFMDDRQIAAFGTMLHGADDMKALVEELENADGAGQKMADTVGDTLQGSIFKVKSAFQGLSIAIVKQFGGSLKKTLTKLAAWMNSLVKDEKKLKKLWNTVKLVTKAIGYFVVGLIPARMALKAVAVEATGASIGMRALAGATALAKGALHMLKLAIVSTGIGALIVMLGSLASKFLFASDTIELDFTPTLTRVKDAFIDTEVEIRKVLSTEKSLIKTKKEMAKIMKKEGDNLKDNVVETEKYNRLKVQEKIDITNLNKVLKLHNKELVDENTNIGLIKESTKDLIETMKEKALAQIFIDLQGVIVKAKVESETIVDKLKEFKSTYEGFGIGRKIIKKGEPYKLGSKMVTMSYLEADYEGLIEAVIDDPSLIGRDIDAVVGGGKKGRKKYHATTERVNHLMALLEQYDMTLVELQETLSADYVTTETANLEQIIEEQAGGINITDLMSRVYAEEGGEGGEGEEEEECKTGYHWDPVKKKCVKDETDAVYKMTTIVNKHLKSFRAKGIKDEEAYRLGLLEAQRDGLKEYIGQEKNKEEKKKGQAQLDKLNKQIKDEEYKQLLTSIDRERKVLKDAAELAVVNQTEYFSVEMLLSEEQNQEAILKKEDLFAELNAIDEQQNAKVLQATIDAGKNEADIRAKINQQTIKTEQDNFKKANKDIDEEHESAKDILDLALANELISDTQHKQLMLYLEEDYLRAKLDLYTLYGEDTAAILNNINANEVESIELVKEALQGYLSQLGDLGQSMQDLAGDEEKLSGLRQAGVIITQAAATAEKVLAIANTFTALSKAKLNLQEALGIANTPSFLASNAKKTVSNIKTAASGFISTISSAAKSMPFPANVLAIAATLGVIFGAYKKIKASFGKAETPDAGGGGDDGGSSSSGGGRSSSGAMSYYTYGGQHSTYADGGMVHGKSHSQGGEMFAVGGRVVELEGGEAVINKRSTSMFRSQLSAMNSVGGGVKFADGGVTNNPSFAQTQFDVMNQSSNGGSSRVVVVEADITSTQNTVKTIEAEASF